MEGGIAPIEQIAYIAREHSAMTFLDGVHAVGMYGPQGAGTAAQRRIPDRVDIIQTTMAKAICVIGGFIAGNNTIVDAIRSFAPGFIFTASLPPAASSGFPESIERFRRCNYERPLLHANTSILRAGLELAGTPIAPTSESHIIPIMVGDSKKGKLAAQQLLQEHSVYLQPINSPTVPSGTERFRVDIMPNHTEEQISALVHGMCNVFDDFDIARNKAKVAIA